MLTRIFKSGNSLAVRIPKDMMPADVPEDAEIKYSGGRNQEYNFHPLLH